MWRSEMRTVWRNENEKREEIGLGRDVAISRDVAVQRLY